MCGTVTALFLHPGLVVATTSTACCRFKYDLSGLDGTAVNRLWRPTDRALSWWPETP